MNSRPVRSTVRPDWPQTEYEQEVATQFIAAQPSPSEQEAYEKAWANALAYEELAAGEVPSDEQGRLERDRALRKLSHKIVPATRQAAAPSRVEIHRAALRMLQECGGVENFNISLFVKHVESLPSARRISRKHGTARTLSDHAIRAILKSRLGIVGKPGRKRKKL